MMLVKERSDATFVGAIVSEMIIACFFYKWKIIGITASVFKGFLSKLKIQNSNLCKKSNESNKDQSKKRKKKKSATRMKVRRKQGFRGRR